MPWAVPLAGILLLAAFAPLASAAHATRVPADKRIKSCTHFEPSEDAWNELRLNPLREGTFPGDGIDITITNHDGKTFDWSANRSAVQAVYVRGGNNDASFLYEYDSADGDQNLTTPGEGNEIQYVSFCSTEGPAQQSCPTVSATAESGPSNHLEWTTVDDADAYKVYRAVGSGSFQFLKATDGNTTTHDDTDVEQGETYRYKVTAVVDSEETEACNEAAVTAIPVFPTAIAAASATALGAGGYALVRRES